MLYNLNIEIYGGECMQLTPRSKITKAKLGGRSFLYNPSSFQDNTSITYNEIKVPGMTYPIFGYGGGNSRTITFDIYLNDKVEAGITQSFISHLRNFIPPERKVGYQFKAPKMISFAFGWYVKDCWLKDININYSAFSPQLDPIEATVTVTLLINQ